MKPTTRALVATAAVVGLVCGAFGALLDQPWLGLVAGVLAALLGGAALGVGRGVDAGSGLLGVAVGLDDRGPAPDLEPGWLGSDPDDRTASADVVAAVLTDPATGLFNEQYFRAALDTRVAAARRHLRPLALLLFEAVAAAPDDVRRRGPAIEPATVADAVRTTLRESDTVCRLDDGTFAAILEDTPELGAVWTAERLRRALDTRTEAELLRRSGISCYPAHGFTAHQLMFKGRAALVAAREWSQDRVEVAVPDETMRG